MSRDCWCVPAPVSLNEAKYCETAGPPGANFKVRPFFVSFPTPPPNGDYPIFPDDDHAPGGGATSGVTCISLGVTVVCENVQMPITPPQWGHPLIFASPHEHDRHQLLFSWRRACVQCVTFLFHCCKKKGRNSLSHWCTISVTSHLLWQKLHAQLHRQTARLENSSVHVKLNSCLRGCFLCCALLRWKQMFLGPPSIKRQFVEKLCQAKWMPIFMQIEVCHDRVAVWKFICQIVSIHWVTEMHYRIDNVHIT